MAVDVGKRTAPLGRIEVAGVNPKLCFSLLTKGGSLDLESNNSEECETLVRTFSLMLDEVHKVGGIGGGVGVGGGGVYGGGRGGYSRNNNDNFPFQNEEGSLINFV